MLKRFVTYHIYQKHQISTKKLFAEANPICSNGMNSPSSVVRPCQMNCILIVASTRTDFLRFPTLAIKQSCPSRIFITALRENKSVWIIIFDLWDEDWLFEFNFHLCASFWSWDLRNNPTNSKSVDKCWENWLHHNNKNCAWTSLGWTSTTISDCCLSFIGK